MNLSIHMLGAAAVQYQSTLTRRQHRVPVLARCMLFTFARGVDIIARERPSGLSENLLKPAGARRRRSPDETVADLARRVMSWIV